MKKTLIVWSAVALVAATVACSQQSPSATQPSATSAAAVSPAQPTTKLTVQDLSGVTLTSPTPSAPSDGQVFKFTDQPLTLTVKNAVSTGSAPLTYSFQVASDAAFANAVFTQAGVA